MYKKQYLTVQKITLDNEILVKFGIMATQLYSGFVTQNKTSSPPSNKIGKQCILQKPPLRLVLMMEIIKTFFFLKYPIYPLSANSVEEK